MLLHTGSRHGFPTGALSYGAAPPKSHPSRGNRLPCPYVRQLPKPRLEGHVERRTPGRSPSGASETHRRRSQLWRRTDVFFFFFYLHRMPSTLPRRTTPTLTQHEAVTSTNTNTTSSSSSIVRLKATMSVCGNGPLRLVCHRSAQSTANQDRTTREVSSPQAKGDSGARSPPSPVARLRGGNQKPILVRRGRCQREPVPALPVAAASLDPQDLILSAYLLPASPRWTDPP